MCDNHYAKFEYKRMKTFGVSDYTNQTPPTHFEWKNCLKSNTCKNVTGFEMSTKLEVHIFNM